MEKSGTITSVERHKKQRQRYHIFVDGQFAFSVHEDILLKHHLFKGQRIEVDQLRQILQDEERNEAYLKALRWLGLKMRSKKELRAYLKRNKYEDSMIDECLRRLEKERYLDDGRYSATLAEERLKLQGKGKHWIRQELMAKGVERNIIQQTLSEIADRDERASAVALARKRWSIVGKQEDRLGAKRKLYAYLLRRGFTADAVRSAVQEVAGSTEDDTVDEWE